MSKYLEKFKAAAAADVLPKVSGATLVVEVLPKEELKSKGGIILGAVDKTHRATAEDFRRSLGLVLAVGEGYSDGTKCATSIGAVVLMPYSPLYLSEFPGLEEYTENTIALINEADVLVSYSSLDALTKSKAVFNGAT